MLNTDGRQVTNVVMLTGAIASGKSTVREMFQGLAVPCLDLDQVAKDLQADIHSMPMVQIATHFPNTINPDGTLNRSKMRTLVVSDPGANVVLKAIMTPPVMEIVRRWKHAHRVSPYVIVESALVEDITEYDATIYVVAAKQIQEHRLLQRNPDWTTEQVQGMMALGAARDRYLEIHGIVVDNSHGIIELRERVMAIHKFFMSEWDN